MKEDILIPKILNKIKKNIMIVNSRRYFKILIIFIYINSIN